MKKRPFAANKRQARWLIVALLGLPSIIVSGQKGTNDEKLRVKQLVDAYIQFFDLIKTEAFPKNESGFVKLFTPGRVPMPNDYYDNGSEDFFNPGDYFDDITNFFKNGFIKSMDIQVSDKSYYGKDGNDYYAWVHKSFRYEYDKRAVFIAGWVRLTIRWMSGKAGYRIVAVENSWQPDDADGDDIADAYDRCVASEPGEETNIYGCPAEEPVVVWVPKPPPPPDTITRIIIENPQQPRREAVVHTRHARPSARFGIEFTGGGVVPVGTSFSRQELLEPGANTWKDSGALAHRYGYTAGLSLQYNMFNWLGFGVGYQHFFIPLNEKKLMLQVKNFLGNSGVNYSSVGVRSDAYRLHLIYGALAFGNFKRSNFVVKGELLTGEVHTDMVWNSQLEVQASTQDGHQAVSATLPLKFEPFMVYGIKGTLQWGIGRFGAVRFQASIEYLRGKSDMPSQSITFNILPGSILIASPDLQLLNVNAGLHFTLHHSRSPEN